MRFYFNDALGICQHFYYSGCDGNANNFPTEEACIASCISGSYPPLLSLLSSLAFLQFHQLCNIRGLSTDLTTLNLI